MTQAQTITPESPVARSEWAAALLRIEEERVIGLAERLAERYAVRLKRVPKAGLAMMRLRDSVQGQAFNLGELPLSSAHVVFTDKDGNEHEGGSQITRDHEALAVAVAVCDAVMASGVEGCGEVSALIREGSEAVRQESRIRRSMLERSRVSFSLMNQEALPQADASEAEHDHA